MQVQIATCQFSLYSNCKCTSSKIAGMMDDSFDSIRFSSVQCGRSHSLRLQVATATQWTPHRWLLLDSTKILSSARIFHMVSLSLCSYLLQSCTSWMDTPHMLTISWLPSVLFIAMISDQSGSCTIYNACCFSLGHKSTPLHSVQPMPICPKRTRCSIIYPCVAVSCSRPPYE